MSEADQTEQLTVRLASESGEVNAAAVASMMTAMVSLLSEAQQGLDANKDFLVKARPFAQGSFEIPLDLIVLAAGTMFASNPLIGDILEVIRGYFETKNRLQGGNVEKKDDTTIIIQGNEIKIRRLTLNLLDPKSLANQDVAKALEAVEGDQSVSGIELVRGDEVEPFVKVNRSQFGYYKIDTPSSESERKVRDVKSRETLTVSAPELQGEAQWKLILKGHNVRVKIDDQDFLKRVREGTEIFAAGDRLIVDLVIHQEYNPTINDFENKSFTIKYVHKHEKKDEQQMFFD